MPGAVPSGVDDVAESAGNENEKRTATVAEPAVHGRKKNAAGERVAEHVQGVGMKGERGDGAPDFTVKNSLAGGGAA